MGNNNQLNRTGAQGVDDAGGGDALVDVQRNGLDVEGEVLGLAGPLELRVEARVVGVGFFAPGQRVHVGDASGRVVEARVGVAVGVGGHGSCGFARRHRAPFDRRWAAERGACQEASDALESAQLEKLQETHSCLAGGVGFLFPCGPTRRSAGTCGEHVGRPGQIMDGRNYIMLSKRMWENFWYVIFGGIATC